MGRNGLKLRGPAAAKCEAGVPLVRRGLWTNIRPQKQKKAEPKLRPPLYLVNRCAAKRPFGERLCFFPGRLPVQNRFPCLTRRGPGRNVRTMNHAPGDQSLTSWPRVSKARLVLRRVRIRRATDNGLMPVAVLAVSPASRLRLPCASLPVLTFGAAPEDASGPPACRSIPGKEWIGLAVSLSPRLSPVGHSRVRLNRG